MKFVNQLKTYVLPDGLLPLAPRQPFGSYSIKALEQSAKLSLAQPEKRGPLSHAVRELCNLNCSEGPAHTVTIEAHFDSATVPAALADNLLELGFEPDGFCSFVPEHFRDHFTLKYEIAAYDAPLRRQIRRDVELQYAELKALLSSSWPNLEAYIELEVYTDSNRRIWEASALRPNWRIRLPYDTGAFRTVNPPRTASESKQTGVDLQAAKHADIHAKISQKSEPLERTALIESLSRIGFYSVRTWAGNDVCTAQFLSAQDAHAVFNAFCLFFTEAGGCSEITIESVAMVWRNATFDKIEPTFATMPPLVVQVGPN